MGKLLVVGGHTKDMRVLLEGNGEWHQVGAREVEREQCHNVDDYNPAQLRPVARKATRDG